MPRKKSIEDQENAERWLLTYADLITLLLAFFIVMYSMSRIDAKKFGSMQAQLSNVLRGGATVFPKGEDFDAEGAGLLQIGDLRTIQWRVINRLSPGGKQSHGKNEGKLLRDLDIADAINTEVTERGLTIHIKDYALFESGKADLKPEAVAVLEAVAEEIGIIGNHIVVEGHTDNLPIKTAKFPSNWELSTARATNVLRFLVDKKSFTPERISARGFGEYRPVASNATISGRAKNRRVDIVILSDQLTMMEPHSGDVVGKTVPTISHVDLIDTLEHVSVEPDILDR
jgi:chemotaxis protein MotB